MKERVPVQSKLTGVGDFFRPALLKDVNFALWAVAAVLQTTYLYIPPFFIPSKLKERIGIARSNAHWLLYVVAYATYIGLTPSQGSILVSVLSATNFVGRIVAGYI